MLYITNVDECAGGIMCRFSWSLMLVMTIGIWACGYEDSTPNKKGIAESGYFCRQCHTNKVLLAASLAADPSDYTPKAKSSSSGPVSRFSGVDAIYINPSFLDTVHGRRGCQACHGGVMPAKDRRGAHSGDFHIHVDPEKVCIQCHEGIVKNFLNNLHTKFNGLKPTDAEFIKRASVYEMRVSDDAESKKLLAEGIEQGGCAACHQATCGSCHITLPDVSGGGFPGTGHTFHRQPSDVYNCTACHGSKGKEYMLSGYSAEEVKNSDVVKALDLKDYKVQPDVHYQNGLHCTDCHNENWMHGAGPDIAGSLIYNDAKLPTCQDCHVTGQENKFYKQTMHQMHARPGVTYAPYLQCQICHAQVYPNYLSRHLTPNDNGIEPPPDYKFYTLKIAKNPLKLDFYKNNFPDMGKRRPYDYSLVRRTGVVPDTFDAYRPNGPTVLGHYTDYPTWKYATPHTIALDTPQTANGCKGCHENYDGGELSSKQFFLTGDFLDNLFTNGLGKVKNGPGPVKAASYLKKELEANAPILMDDFFKPATGE